VNRAQRRAEERRKNRPVIHGQIFIGDPDVIARLAPHCPDCASELDYWTDNDGMPHVDVMHDDTCPTWHAMQRRAHP
jgi:hypothetical protein